MYLVTRLAHLTTIIAVCDIMTGVGRRRDFCCCLARRVKVVSVQLSQ
jgi:hypothetical protein